MDIPGNRQYEPFQKAFCGSLFSPCCPPYSCQFSSQSQIVTIRSPSFSSGISALPPACQKKLIYKEDGRSFTQIRKGIGKDTSSNTPSSIFQPALGHIRVSVFIHPISETHSNVRGNTNAYGEETDMRPWIPRLSQRSNPKENPPKRGAVAAFDFTTLVWKRIPF